MEMVESLAQGTPLVALTGPAGAGKTTMAAALDLELRGQGVQVMRVRRGEAGDVGLRTLSSQLLGKPEAEFTVNDVEALYEVMLPPEAPRHRSVIIIDDAELLQPGALEYLHLLSGISVGRMPQIVFIGNSTFWDRIDLAAEADLKGRITQRWELALLDGGPAARPELATEPGTVATASSEPIGAGRRSRLLMATACAATVAGVIGGAVGLGAQSEMWHRRGLPLPPSTPAAATGPSVAEPQTMPAAFAVRRQSPAVALTIGAAVSAGGDTVITVRDDTPRRTEAADAVPARAAPAAAEASPAAPSSARTEQVPPIEPSHAAEAPPATETAALDSVPAPASTDTNFSADQLSAAEPATPPPVELSPAAEAPPTTGTATPGSVPVPASMDANLPADQPPAAEPVAPSPVEPSRAAEAPAAARDHSGQRRCQPARRSAAGCRTRCTVAGGAVSRR